jgi:hypothetical protein
MGSHVHGNEPSFRFQEKTANSLTKWANIKFARRALVRRIVKLHRSLCEWRNQYLK